MTIHRLLPTIDVYVRGIGYCKAIAWLGEGSEINTIWKCRRYDTGRVVNAFDDDIFVYPAASNGETELIIPEDWKPKTKNINHGKRNNSRAGVKNI